MAASYKAAMIPIVRWKSICSVVPLNPDNPLAPQTKNPKITLERIAIPEVLIEEPVTTETI
jgi:hypothetical protein